MYGIIGQAALYIMILVASSLAPLYIFRVKIWNKIKGWCKRDKRDK